MDMEKPDYVDHYVLQGNYGGVYGWEDLTAEVDKEEIKSRLREYLENEPSTTFRVQKEYRSGKRVTVHGLNLWG